MAEYILQRSTNKNKKYALKIIQPEGHTKTINFGQRGAEDYTKHHDQQRMQRYTQRHIKEKIKGFWTNDKANLQRPSYLSKNLLWNDKTSSLSKAIKDVETRQKIHIVNKIQ